ncbi:MAG: rRNA adenine dimethyltransferase family protein [Saprospiraceae bacterium]
MVDNRHLIPEMVGMFQKEVAERVVAPPGNKTYGVISVLVQAYYEGKYLFSVDKRCFTPPPKVQSAVIRLVRKENMELGCNERLFKSIVKASFGQRRKMLRNSLKPFVKDNDLLADEKFTLRPEQVSLEGFIELTKFIEANDPDA